MTAGRVIGGRYQVEGLLGRGGTASVWRARDLRLDRRVAIKELTGSWLEEPTALGRFDREARTVARLAHPNTVAVYDVDIHGDSPYLVMELIEGVTVAQLLNDGVLSVARAVTIAAQTCDGLSAAHDAGVIHRDVKPANLMLTPAGTVKICDFGIARALSRAGDTGLTGPRFVMGTTRYMAPEQVRGENVDARADLYGLGCTMYAMLTGVPPFSGGGVDVLQQHLDRAPVALREHRADIPPLLDALVEQLLAKAPADRPRDAGEVKARLADVMNDPTVAQTPLSLALPPSRGGPIPILSGRVRGRASSVSLGRATVAPPLHARRMWQVGAVAVVVLAVIGTWVLVDTRSTPDDTVTRRPGSTAVVDAATAGSELQAPAAGGPSAVVGTGGLIESTLDAQVTGAPLSTDPVAALRLAIQEQVNTGNLNPDKASDLYKQVDLIAKAMNTQNADEVAKNIKAMRDKLTMLRAGGQLSASGYDTLVSALDAIAAAS